MRTRIRIGIPQIAALAPALSRGPVRLLVAVLLLVPAAVLAPSSPARAERLPPRHLVLVTVDTLRADHLGSYGHPRVQTPAIDALAAESLRFERAYAHSSMTFPSVATLLTGVLPARHGVLSNRGKLPRTVPTLATRLRDAGFATGAFIGNYALRPSRKLGRGFQHYTRHFESEEEVRAQPENPARVLTDQAIAWLAHPREERRFFLWIHYQEPHGPYTPPSFAAPAPQPDEAELPRSPTNSGRGAIPNYQWLGHGRLSEYRARYEAEIATVDSEVGRLLEHLREQGVLDDALLIFTSDHGEAFGEDELYCAHGEGLDDALLHVPLLLRQDGLVPGVRDDRVGLADVAPTALEALGIEPAPPSRSLRRPAGDRVIVSAVHDARPTGWRSIRDGSDELREQQAGASDFTRGAATPLEAAATTRTRLAASLEELAPWPEALVETELSSEEREALEALGYLD